MRRLGCGSRARAAVVLLVLGTTALGTMACGTGAGAGGPDETRASPPGVTGDVTVLAAASLTEAFTTLGERFEEAHPDVRVRLGFAGSSALAASVVAGAPADVLATASRVALQPVLDAGLVAGQPQVVARNALEIAVPPGNPGRVRGLADLADPGRTIALCAPEVPCGAAAAEVFADAGLSPAPDSYEQDVKATLAKVALGEVDAGLVYRTDVRAAGGRVAGLAVPEAEAAANDYLLVALRDAGAPAAAEAFVDYVRSEEGQRVLADAGFERP